MTKIRILLLGFCLLGLQISSCQNNTNNKKQSKIELQTFTDFPKDIEGCSCYFSKTEKDFKNSQYFFVNDFANIAYVKVNNQLVKLELIDHDKSDSKKGFYLYKTSDFKLRIDITKSVQSGDEVSKIYGQVTLIFANGEKQVFKFVGECGC